MHHIAVICALLCVIDKYAFVASATATPHISNLKTTYEHVISRRFTNDSKVWDIRNNVPGEPGIDYPVLANVPLTSFTCESRNDGYYADAETRCQVFRVCANTDLTGKGFAFLCPNGTLFNQKYFVCDWWKNVNCAQSNRYYGKNREMSHHLGSLDDMMEAVQQMMDFTKNNGNPYHLMLRKPTGAIHPNNTTIRPSPANNGPQNTRPNRPRTRQPDNESNMGSPTIVNSMPKIKQYVNPNSAKKQLTSVPNVTPTSGPSLKQPQRVVMLVNSLGETIAAPLSVLEAIQKSTSSTPVRINPPNRGTNRYTKTPTMLNHRIPTTSTRSPSANVQTPIPAPSGKLPQHQRKQLISMLGEHIPLQPVSSVYVKPKATISNANMTQSDKDLHNGTTYRNQLRKTDVHKMVLDKPHMNPMLPQTSMQRTRNEDLNKMQSSTVGSGMPTRILNAVGIATTKANNDNINRHNDIRTQNSTHHFNNNVHFKEGHLNASKIETTHTKLRTQFGAASSHDSRQNSGKLVFSGEGDLLTHSAQSNRTMNAMPVQNAQGNAQIVYSGEGDLLSHSSRTSNGGSNISDESTNYQTQTYAKTVDNQHIISQEHVQTTTIQEHSTRNRVEDQANGQFIYSGEGNLLSQSSRETHQSSGEGHLLKHSSSISSKDYSHDHVSTFDSQEHLTSKNAEQQPTGTLVYSGEGNLLSQSSHENHKNNGNPSGNMGDANSDERRTQNQVEKQLAGELVYSGEGDLLSQLSRENTPSNITPIENTYSGQENFFAHTSNMSTKEYSQQHVRITANQEHLTSSRVEDQPTGQLVYSGEGNLLSHSSRENHTNNGKPSGHTGDENVLAQDYFPKNQVDKQLTGEFVYSGAGDLLSQFSRGNTNTNTKTNQTDITENEEHITRSRVEEQPTGQIVYSGEGNLLSQSSRENHKINGNSSRNTGENPITGELFSSGEGDLLSQLSLENTKTNTDNQEHLTRSRVNEQPTGQLGYSGEGNLLSQSSRENHKNENELVRVSVVSSNDYSVEKQLAGEFVYSGEGDLLNQLSRENVKATTTPFENPYSGPTGQLVYSGEGNLLSQSSRENHKNSGNPIGNTREVSSEDYSMGKPTAGEFVYSGEGDLLSQLLREYKPANTANQDHLTPVYSGEGNLLSQSSLENHQNTGNGLIKKHNDIKHNEEHVTRSQVNDQPTGQMVYAGIGNYLSQTTREHQPQHVSPSEKTNSGAGNLIAHPTIFASQGYSHEYAVNQEHLTRNRVEGQLQGQIVQVKTAAHQENLTRNRVKDQSTGELVYSGEGNLLSQSSKENHTNNVDSRENTYSGEGHLLSHTSIISPMDYSHEYLGNQKQLTEQTVYSGEGQLLSQISPSENTFLEVMNLLAHTATSKDNSNAHVQTSNIDSHNHITTIPAASQPNGHIEYSSDGNALSQSTQTDGFKRFGYSTFPAMGYLPIHNLLDNINNLQDIPIGAHLNPEKTNTADSEDSHRPTSTSSEDAQSLISKQQQLDRIYQSLSNRDIIDINDFI